MLTFLSIAALAAEPPAPGLGPVVAEHTAHALQWGEVQVGTGGVHVGLAPRLQLGTRPWVDALGLPNASVRLQLADSENVDLALQGAALTSAMAGLDLLVLGAGGTLSVAVGPIAVHAGGRYNRITGHGLPEAGPQWVTNLVGTDPVAASTSELAALGVTPWLDSATTTVRGALELRLARGGGLLVQGSANVWGASATGASVTVDGAPMAANIDALALVDQYSAPGATWVASVAWQQTIGRFTLRAGGGSSSVPYAWVTQAVAANARFGGFEAKPEVTP